MRGSRVATVLQLICLGIVIFWTGCKSTKSVEPVNDIQALDSLVQSENAGQEIVTKSPSFYLAKPIIWKQEHIKLRLSFDWEKQHAIGKAELTVVPFQSSQGIEIDAVGFLLVDDVKAVNPKDSSLQIEQMDYEDKKKIKIKFSRVCTSKDTIRININYVARPTENLEKGLINTYHDQGMFFTGGERDVLRDRQIWTQGEPTSNSAWMPCIDAPNQKTSQEIYLTVDTALVALSNGRLVYMLINGNGTRTFYYKQEKKHAPYLAMIAVGNFDIVEDKWQRKAPISYYIKPEYTSWANRIFGQTPAMMQFLEKRFGMEYPWDKYAQIAVDGFFAGGMENTSATVLNPSIIQDSIGYNDNNYEALLVHELAHQWFGNLVTCKSWSDITLNEAFATYAEYLWIEHQGDKGEMAAKLWSMQKAYYDEATYRVHPLIDHEIERAEELFDHHSYEKGALVLHHLRYLIGDQSFFAGVQKYLADNAFNTVDEHHLRHAMEATSGLDLRAFFDQWFHQELHPRLAWEQKDTSSNKDIILRLSQQQLETGYELFDFEVKLFVAFKDGTDESSIIKVGRSPQYVRRSFDKEIAYVMIVATENKLVETTADLNQKENLAFSLKSKNLEVQKEAIKILFENWVECTPSHQHELANTLIEAKIPGYWKIEFLQRVQRDSVDLDLRPFLKDENPLVKGNAIYYLSLHRLAAKNELLTFLQEPSYFVKQVSIYGLEDFYDDEVEAAILKEAEKKQERIGWSLAGILGRKGGEKVQVFFDYYIKRRQLIPAVYSDYLSRQSSEFIDSTLIFLKDLVDSQDHDKEDVKLCLDELSEKLSKNREPEELMSLLGRIDALKGQLDKK